MTKTLRKAQGKFSAAAHTRSRRNSDVWPYVFFIYWAIIGLYCMVRIVIQSAKNVHVYRQRQAGWLVVTSIVKISQFHYLGYM